MSGITAIHHPLRHVQARPSEIRTIVHIDHTADRSAVNAGTGATPTSTKPSGSTRATLIYSPSTRFPMPFFVVSPKRCESLIRFLISYPTTSTPSR